MLYFFNVFFGSSGEVACDCQLCWIPCHNGLFNANVRCINKLIAMETFKKKPNTKCAVGDALIQRRVKLNKILVEEPVDGPTWCVFAFQWLRAHLADSPPCRMNKFAKIGAIRCFARGQLIGCYMLLLPTTSTCSIR